MNFNFLNNLLNDRVDLDLDRSSVDQTIESIINGFHFKDGCLSANLMKVFFIVDSIFDLDNKMPSELISLKGDSEKERLEFSILHIKLILGAIQQVFMENFSNIKNIIEITISYVENNVDDKISREILLENLNNILVNFEKI